MADIGKNTVDFTDNFDGTLTEPLVLPSAIPNLLVNGATGIAVGMATNIPPHNLPEIVDACIYLLEKWEKIDDVNVADLMQFVQGPDFPTGGIIIEQKGEEGIEAAYGKGRGRVTIQANAHFEEMERGKSRIIVTELPYQVNKSSLIERIAELVRDGGMEGITDLRDESDRQGLRIVIELSKNVEPEKVLTALYKRTPMQSTFSINLLALVDNEPRLLNLKQALRVYLDHRLLVIQRRAEFELERARARAHILEGYLVALKNLDEIISLIRNSPDVETARTRLVKRFKLSEIQANAILELQLRRLAALERKKIETEYKETVALIKELEGLLKSPRKMRAVASEELLKVKLAYGDRRRTQIVSLKGRKTRQTPLTAAELVKEQVVWIGMTSDGTIARMRDDKLPRLSGSDAPILLVKANATDTLYLVSERGVAAAVAVHTLPEEEKLSDGNSFSKQSPLQADQMPVAAFALPARKSNLPEDTYVLTMTSGGMLKKSLLSELPGPSAQTFKLTNVNDGDRLGWVGLTDGKKEILLATAQGMAIRFGETDVRPMGLTAAGVNGIKLGVGDVVIGMQILPVEGEIFMLASDGKGKRVEQKDFPLQGRYGKGVIAWELPKLVTLAGLAAGKKNDNVSIFMAKAAPKMARMDAAPLRKRSAVRGEAVVEVKPGDAVLGISEGWQLERFVEIGKKAENIKRNAGKKVAQAKGKSGKSRKSTGKKGGVKKAAVTKKGTGSTRKR